MEQYLADFAYSIHWLALLGTGLLLMLLDAFGQRRALALVAALGFCSSAILAVPGVLEGTETLRPVFAGLAATGGTLNGMHIVLCLGGLAVLAFLPNYMRTHGRNVAEVYALLVFATLGLSLFASGTDLLMLFLGLETFSICFYVLAGLFQRDVRSVEAGLKYFLLGAFSSGFLLYGIALLYGVAGGTNLAVIAQGVFTPDPALSLTANPVFWIGAGLLLVGLLFKVAAFPFHSWAPDVYAGAPTPVAGFLATVGKVAVFTVLALFVLRALPMGDFYAEASPKIPVVLAVAALASIIYGNTVAIHQRNVKRLLAYSGIAHAGYAMLALVAGPAGGLSVLFYMLVYTLMTIGAFGVVSWVESRIGSSELAAWRSLYRAHPWAAGLMSVFLLSLAGLPPLAGFMAKYQVFGALIRAGVQTEMPGLVALAAVGILASVAGVYYYLRVIQTMYFTPPLEQAPSDSSLSVPRNALPMLGALALAAALVVLGVYPSLVLEPLRLLYAADGLLTMVGP